MGAVIRAGFSNAQAGAMQIGVAVCVLDDTRLTRDERVDAAGYCIDAPPVLPAGCWRFTAARALGDYALVMPAYVGRDDA